MTPQPLDFYFDFISPFACFAWRRISAICDARNIVPGIHPVPFGKLLDHWGQLGPAEIPPRRENIFKYGFRYAAANGFTFNPPAQHPFYPLHALRLALPEVSGPHQRTVVTAVFEAGWSQGHDLGSLDQLQSILDEAGLDGADLCLRAAAPAAKDALKQETRAAVDRGVFGVPTIFVGDELFFGNDQVEFVEQCLDGRDPVDPETVAEVLARPRGIERKNLKRR